MTRTRLLSLPAACAVLALSPAASAAKAPEATASAKPTISMSGSTSVYPLADKLARGYLQRYPGSIRFRLQQGGSDVGINDVARGRTSIGNSSRDLQAGDPGGLQFSKIARDGVCVVTHPGNPVANLGQADVQNIFSGRVRRWEDVPGAQASGAIDLTVRTQASGTQDAFRNIFMGPSLNVAPSASQKLSNGLVQAAVRSNRNAIGYVDFRFTGGTHAVAYKGVACTLRNAKSGQYPGIRNFWFVTRGKPAGVVARFIDWARSPRVQSSIVARDWVAIR